MKTNDRQRQKRTTEAKPGGIKLYDLLGLNPPEYKFSDFEPALRNRYLLNFLLDAGIAICGAIFAVTSRYLSAGLVFAAVVTASVAYHSYMVAQLLGGQVLFVEGECLETNKSTRTVLKKTVFGTSRISVLCDDKVFVVPVRHDSPFKQGAKVRIYFADGTTFVKDEDTIDVPSPILVLRVKSPRRQATTDAEA